jgi:molecular chaperone GrpE
VDNKKHGGHRDAEEHKKQEPGAAVVAEEQVIDGAERIRQLEEALAAKENEARENWDKFVRERADLENYRKRVQKEKEELLKYCNESLILEILPVLDSMELALSHASEETQVAVIEGVRLTHNMLLTALKKFGVTQVEAAKGTPFDPACHHAMCQVESGELPANAIVEEFQKGYFLNGRLLRAAMVSVAIAPK